MKKFLPLILGLFISCGSAWVPYDPIVKVEHTSGASSFVCTGIVVGITRVLTAEHCVSDKDTMYVDGKVARLVKKDEAFGLLDTGDPLSEKKVVKLAEDLPEQGAEVAAFGFAYDGPLLRFTRNVAGYVEGDMVLDGPLASGMSGGPILNTKGELVGLNQGTNEVLGLACGIKEIREFLK